MDYMDVIRLSMFQDHYKAKSKVNMSATEARNIRINKKAMERKSRRMDDFAANRSMSDRQRADIKQASAAPKPDLRKLQMQQWKEEKLKKKLMEPKKPPPFKVGVVTHPFVPFRAEKSCKHAKSPQVCLRMTRSATRALQNGVKADNQSVPTKSFAPPNSKFHAPVIIKTKTKYTPKKVYKTKMFSGILSHTPKKVGEISLSRKNNNTANLKNTILNEKKITISKLHKKKELNAETVVPARRRSLRKKTITIELDRPLEEELDNKPTNTENLKDSSSKTKKRLSKKSLQFDDIEKQNHTEIYNENDKMNESNITTPLKEEKNRRSSKRNSVKIEHLQELSDSPMKKMTPKINKTPKITLNNSFATPYAVSCVNEESPSLILKNQNLIVMSPLVTVSRGKGNSKRESAKRISFGYDEASSPQKTAQYFRSQLDKEVARLQDMCETWKAYQNENENSIPDDGKDLIHLAIGQTQLLINKKLEQFRSLIAQCENGEICEGEGLIKFQDLQGFWDMVYMQVENCDLRFIKLTEMRERNWQEEFAVLDKPKKKIEKSKPLKSFKASSGIKEAIKAARMKSKISSKSNNDELKVDNLDTKTFNGGFFSVTSPIKVSDEKLNNLTRTPMKCNSLLKAVVSSEAKKKIRCTPHNSKAILKTPNINKIAFNLDTSVSDEDLEKSIMQPIDLNKTPAKSILKAPGSSKVHRKSVKIISANNSPMKGRTSFINSFENLQLETDSKNYEELVKSIKEKENSPAKSRKTRKIKRNPSLNLISFDSPERPQTRSRRSLRNSILEKA